MEYILPTKPGQVTAIWVSKTHIPKEKYVLCQAVQDPIQGGPVKVCSISELELATFQKREPVCEYIPVHNLYVVADSFVEYVRSLITHCLPPLFVSPLTHK